MFIASFICNINHIVRRNNNIFNTYYSRPLLKCKRFVSGNAIELELNEEDERCSFKKKNGLFCLTSSIALLYREYQQIAIQYITQTIQNNCYLIHPYIKWGPKKVFDSNPEQQLEEAVSLIRTLDPWRVYDR